MSVHISLLNGNPWDEGWDVKSPCNDHQLKPACFQRNWFSQGDIAPVDFKGGGKQFIDPHTPKRGILFRAAGATKTAQ